MSNVNKSRYVWSPENGGCIMEQHWIKGSWMNWCSQDEGDFPVHDKRAKAVVKWQNLQLRRNKLLQKSNALQIRAAMLQQKQQKLMKDIRGSYAVLRAGAE